MSFIDDNGERVILKGEYEVFINDGQPDNLTKKLYNRNSLSIKFNIDTYKKIEY